MVSRRAVALSLVLVAGCTMASPEGHERPSRPDRSVVPPVVGGNFADGEAHIEVTGGRRATLALPLSRLVPSRFAEGSLSAAWNDDRGNLFTIIGSSLGPGRHRTGPMVRLTIVIDRDHGYSSRSDDCLLELGRAEPSVITGSFECPRLGRAGAPVAATGTFSAIG